MDLFQRLPPQKKKHPSEKPNPCTHHNSVALLFPSLGTSVSDCFKACRTGEAVFNSSFPVVLYFYTPTTSSTRTGKMAQSLHIGVFAFHSTKILSKVALVSSILSCAALFSLKKSSSQKQVHPSTSPNPFFGEVKEAGKRDLKESRTKTRVVHTRQLYIRSWDRSDLRLVNGG